MWSLGPAYKPFMDTRLVLRTRAEFEEYLAVVDDPTLFDAWERDKGFAYVLLPVAYPDRYLPLVAHLYGSQAWQLAYTDGSEALFARRSNAAIARGGDRWDLGAPAVVDRIVADLSHRFGADARLQEAARAQLATLLLAIDAPAMAERSLDGLATPLADALRARARLATGDLDGAARLAEVSLARDGADVPSLDVLALVAARQNDSSRARQLLRRALEVDPYDVEAEKLLARWEGQ
jgi:tetratricopeptide (TPR) repeat protein